MLGLDEREQDLIHTAALLHDIGKFILPDSVLFANRKLTDEEWELIKLHPEQGAKLSSGSRAMARWPRSSCTITRSSPAAATRPASRATTSRSAPGSCPSPTPTT